MAADMHVVLRPCLQDLIDRMVQAGSAVTATGAVLGGNLNSGLLLLNGR